MGWVPMTKFPRSQFFKFFVVGSAVLVGVGLPAHAAHALDVPNTTPTITAPVSETFDGGDVVISATSTAPTVQFRWNGTPIGGPVSVVDGSASTSFDTWGWSNGSLFVITAADCNDAGCGATTSVEFHSLNAAPVLTAPTNSETTSSLPTLTATRDGGGIAFGVDTEQVDLDTTPPFAFTFTTPLSGGQHIVWARGCDAAGTVCVGGEADAVIYVPALHPSITSATSRFSPNGDGRGDTATVNFSLPDAESVSWTVTNYLDTVVRGPTQLGAFAAGSHSLHWNGLNNADVRVPDGGYTLTLSTTATIDGAPYSGTVSKSITVDTVAPTLGLPTGRNVTFYPVHDGYRDAFASKVSDDSTGSLSLLILTTTGHAIRVLSRTNSGPGTFSLSWDGKNSGGHLVPAGTYHFRWDAQDRAGNRSQGSTYKLVVSLRHLVVKTATLTEHGSADVTVGASKSCASSSKSHSAFSPNGLLLMNNCSLSEFEAVIAVYGFHVPGAIVYSHIQLSSYGYTPAPPGALGSLIFNDSTQDVDVINPDIEPQTTSRQWLNLGGAAATHRVSSTHEVVVMLGLANSPHARYDIGEVRIVVTYKALS
jgi:flagellar hook assembly protein FlgD